MAGSGWGQECGLALRPRSWRRPSRGPGALSAPPPSRRLLARVTPAAPWTRGWTRAERGAFLLASRVRDPRPAWGRAQGLGSRGGERTPRPDAFPSPQTPHFPDSLVSPLHPRRRRAPPRAGLRAGMGAVAPICGLGNRGWVEPFASRWGRATHTAPRVEVTDAYPPRPALWDPLGEARCTPARALPGRRLCFLAPKESLGTGPLLGRAPRPAPSHWPGAPDAVLHSRRTRGSCTRNRALGAEPASGQGFSQAGDTCGCTAGTRVGQAGLPGHPPPCAGPRLDECRAAPLRRTPAVRCIQPDVPRPGSPSHQGRLVTARPPGWR